MKQRLILIALALVAIGFVTITAWPRNVILLGSDDTVSGTGLNVSILRSNTWDSSVADHDGIATFGRGPWRMPWSSVSKTIIVYDDKNVYWEGHINPKCIGSIKLELNTGRPKQSEISHGDHEQAGAGQPATRPESKPEDSDKPQPESEGRSR